MSSKDNRRYYLSRGLCPRCGGKNRVQPGRMLCIECQQKHDEEQRSRRNRWREEGRCTRCGAERDCEKKLCAKCRAYMSDLRRNNAKNGKQRRDNLREAGMCTRCGKFTAEPGRNWCKRCQATHKGYTKGPEYRAKVNAIRDQRRKAGLCIDCGKPVKDGRSRCQTCRDTLRDSRIKSNIIKRIEREAKEARR